MAYESHRVQNILFNDRKDVSPFPSSGGKSQQKEDKLEEFEKKEQRKK